MFRSLRIRIVLILTLLIVAVMVVVGTFLINSVASFYHEDFARQMEQVFTDDFMLTLKKAAKGEYAFASLDEVMQAYGGPLGIDIYRDYYILDAGSGAFLAGPNKDAGSSLERTPNLIRAMAGGVGNEVSRFSNYFDYAVYVAGEGGGRYVVYIKDSKEELGEMTWILFAIILQALFFGLIIAVSMSYFLAKAITNPVDSITKGAKMVASGEFSHKLPVKSRDEIGTLTQTFNAMAGVLKTTVDEIEGERNKLSTIFLYLADGVAAFLRDGSLLHINRAACDMLGKEPGEGLFFDDIMDINMPGIDMDKLLALAPGQSLSCETEQGERILEIHFAPFNAEPGDGDEQNSGIIAVIHDVTEQRKFEKSRREFVANVSHELRTPLTSIKSYTETVLENQPMQKEQQERFLGVVINEADRMTRIVRDLLVLSRLDNKKMDWVFSRFRVLGLLDMTYNTMLMDAKSHRHELILTVENELGEMTGDRDRIEQVLINVLSNAIKYTQDGGRVELIARRDGDTLKITVSDDGYGIPKEDLPRLFERFYRVDKARSRERGGTGLGLAIAREIILAHNGNIEVKSEVGKGTQVIIRLPCTREDGDSPDGRTP